ncbi:MAG: CpsB/CapC family capsule biosynthesis tyrosine phosphatase [Rikenellaceae bacterium]
MFNFFTSKIPLIESEILTDLTDIHSHILPCVDDGSASVEDSIHILDTYENLGVKKVKFTPHIMENYPKNNASSLKIEFEKFKSQYKGNIELSLGAEYMLDAGFQKHFTENEVLTITEDHILVETSFMYPPINIYETISDIMSKGYFVILAHPERYTYMNVEDYDKLKSMGVLFQMNLQSIIEYYGKEASKKAQYLLKISAYDFIGTDVHNPRMLEPKFKSAKLDKKTINKILSVKNRGNLIIDGK